MCGDNFSINYKAFVILLGFVACCSPLHGLDAASAPAQPAAGVPLLTTASGSIIDWRGQPVEMKGIGW
jgi:hypothetical protein